MNPSRYFISNMNFTPFRNPTLINGGLINRIFNSIKTFNWKGLINGAGKTINIVNQTIPLIKQAKPMINNVRSIVSLTKAFNSETTLRKYPTQSNKLVQKSIKTNNNPTFFI